MSISTTTSRVRYVGTGLVSVYAVPYYFRAITDLRVTTLLNGVFTVLALNVDYTVDLNAATITLTVALPSDVVLTIRRVRPLTQLTEFRNQGPYFPETHERAFDNDTMVSQQQQDEIDRSIKAPESDDEDLDMTLPPASERVGKYLAFGSDGQPIASSGVINPSIPVSEFMETMLDDASASAVMTTLGFSAYFKTLIVAASAAAMRALLGFAGSGGTIQGVNIEAGAISKPKMDSSTTSWMGEMSNLALSLTVGASALTVAVKGQDGNDPSATSPSAIGFRAATATSGAYNQRRISTALSLSVPSGTTLGATSAKLQLLYVYAIDNAGTVELAISGTRFDEGSRQDTTAISGGASNRLLYSTTARTGVPIKLIARLKSTQTTAGTWAAVPSEVSMVPFTTSDKIALANRSSDQTFTSGSATDMIFDNEIEDLSGMYDPSIGTLTVPETGLLDIDATVYFGVTTGFSGVSEAWNVAVLINGISTGQIYQAVPPSSNFNLVQRIGVGGIAVNQGDLVKLRATQDSGNNQIMAGNTYCRIKFTLRGR